MCVMRDVGCGFLGDGGWGLRVPLRAEKSVCVCVCVVCRGFRGGPFRGPGGLFHTPNPNHPLSPTKRPSFIKSPNAKRK